MKPSTRWLVPAAAAAGLIVLFVLLRPGGDEAPPAAAGSPTPTAATTPPPTASAEPTPGSTGTPTALAREIEVDVEEGRVEGPGQVSVPRGTSVDLEVKADVEDEVHVHGYDLMAEVGPGRPAHIRFVADVAGIFEVELERAGTLLLRLEVTP